MGHRRVVVVGAGVGGLTAALALAVRGVNVLVLERASHPGGKLREHAIRGARIDAGPTVFTMRWVLEEIFADAGADLASHLTLTPATTLARHAWPDHSRFDLFADAARSEQAVGEFAGAAEARRFRAFVAHAKKIYQTLEQPFLRSTRPTPLGLVMAAGLRGLPDLWRIEPFVPLWRRLGDYFHDARLRQLFGRYATYCGSSPFRAAATLMLVAHVERDGVWLVEGGMARMVDALARLAHERGTLIRCGADVTQVLVERGKACGAMLASGERIDADAVIVNADADAVARGWLGAAVSSAVGASPASARSLSAMVWTMLAKVGGFPLLRHNVFFSDDYAAEFHSIFAQSQVPAKPTVYVCAQDRGSDGSVGDSVPERLLCLINAPPNGDVHAYARPEIAECETRVFGFLEACGLQVERDADATIVTTPRDFDRLFPGTGGALYGQSAHGWRASFSRPHSRTRIPGLYLAGGSTHPGPGVPMAAMSGKLAAACLLQDRAAG